MESNANQWVLRGGDIIDGRGGARYAADVLFADGRILALLAPGAEAPEEARVLDVSGHVVTPGFVDMHAHSDLAVLTDSAHVAKIAQGVTLEVVGQDGLGYAPVTEPVMKQIRKQISGWNGEPDLDYSWRSVADYLARIDGGSALNVAVLVPHGTIRMMVMGTDDRPATKAELRQIRNTVANGLRDGAMGMSTGLTYTPGMYASDAEIVDALRAVSAVGGYYCPHHRNYGMEVLAGYQACLDVAATAGVPLHLAHCHVNFPQNAGRASEVLAAIDSAMERGLDVTLDSYPYLAGATYLAALLPSWTQRHGPKRLHQLLRDPDSREKILHEIETEGADGNHGVPVDWSTIFITSVRHSANADAVGFSIAELAHRALGHPGRIFCDLLLADEAGTGCLVQVGNEENVRAIMRHRAHTVGSDGILVGEKPHPRGWGTFPRFLGLYARELGLFSLEEAVMHATFRATARLGVDDRGLITEGAWADLVVLDPAQVGSPATYDQPKAPPTGIRDVFVNGQLVLRNNCRTELMPGVGVRRTPR